MPNENHVRLRDDVLRAVMYLLHEQGTQISGVPGVKMTKAGYVNEVLINDLAKRGHWPLKDMETKGV